MLGALVFASLHPSAANIIFHRVDPTCVPNDPRQAGCLRGQICLANGTCVVHVNDDPFFSLPALRHITEILAQNIPVVSSRQLEDDTAACEGYDVALCNTATGDNACCAQLG